MSLINKMLQDLEARQETASDTKAAVYQDLRPVRVERGRGAQPLVVVCLIVLLLVAGLYAGREKIGVFIGGQPVVPLAKPTPPPVSAPVAQPQPTPSAVVARPAPLAPTREALPLPAPAATAEPIVAAAALPPQGATEPPAPAVVSAPPAQRSQKEADVRIVRPKEASPAPTHKGERKPAEANALPRKNNPPVAARLTGSAAVVDKKVRPLTAEEQAEAGYRRAVRFLDQGRPDDAMRELRDVLAEQPQHVKARELAAGIALQNGHWREAQSLLEEGLRQVPNHYLFARLLARVYLDHGAEAKALTVMESAAPQGSNDAEFSALLGLLYQRAGRHADAVAAYERALALNPGDGRTWLGFAISLEGAEQWNAAKNAYLRGREIGLTPPLARYAEQRLTALQER